VSVPVCLGCGEALPKPSGRGRPAVYHGAACRQRARRARLAVAPAHRDLLDVLDCAGRAVAAARRAVTSGGDPASALAELAAVVDKLSAGPVGTATAPEPSDLGHVEESEGATQEPVTKDVTESGRPVPRLARPADRVDLDTVRVARCDDFEVSGSYRVLAGNDDSPILLGFVAHGRRKAWEARTATTGVRISGGPWRTRQDAIVHLLMDSGIGTA
jgi:hypothetical protein